VRFLTEEEIEKIQTQQRAAKLNSTALEKLCDLRKYSLSEAMRGRKKMSEETIARIFSNLKTSQEVSADIGQRMLCTRCKKRLTNLGEKKCRTCQGLETVSIGDPSPKINGQPVPSLEERQVQQWAEKLAGMVTPVYDAIAKLRTEVFDRFAQAENASIANANFADHIYDRLKSIHDRLKLIEKAAPDSTLRPTELASRIEHCMQELSRQGQRITMNRDALDERISALAQAVATQAHTNKISAAEGPPPDADLLRSFANFEKLCIGMRAKCPHLFAATVRRAAGVA